MEKREEQPRRRRESFDSVAESYDLYPSPYPREVVDAVIASSMIHEGSRVRRSVAEPDS